MSKWFITSGEADKPKRSTIIDADTENAAMQIARAAFGKEATWKPMTDEQAEGMASWMESLDHARDSAGQLGKTLTAWHQKVKEDYNRKDVQDAVFGDLCAMAFMTGGRIEATEPPFPAILDDIMVAAERGRPFWAGTAARMQRLIWEGHDRCGAELIGFGDLNGTYTEAELMDGETEPLILEDLANFYEVPEEGRGEVADIAGRLHHRVQPATMGITWAEYYAHALHAIFAQCEFELDYDG